MSTEIPQNYTEPITLHFRPFSQIMSDRDFYEFCRLNPERRIELTKEGDLIIMPPTGGETGKRNFQLTVAFGAWVEADGTGIGFDSSTCFNLPNGAKRSPDLAWIRLERWESLTDEEREVFPPICPDFVVELRSRTDDIGALQSKMIEYIENGARLGWLIDPKEKKVYIYTPDSAVICLDNLQTLSGDPLLPGFVINLSKIMS